MFTLPVRAFAGGVIATHVGTVTRMALTASGFGFTCVFHAVRPDLGNLPAMDAIDGAEFDRRVAAATDGGEVA